MSDLDIVRELEKTLNIKIPKRDKSTKVGRGYNLNELNQVVELSLVRCSFGELAEHVNILKNFKHLELLDLGFNRIRNYSFLADLDQLKSLSLRANRLIDCSSLAELNQLLSLNLRQCDIADISDLKKLKKLQKLHLSDNQLFDISVIREFKELRILDLDFVKASKISALRELKKLNQLNLRGNQISDISALGELKDLRTLDLAMNHISDISALKKLKQLQGLHLEENYIREISDLKDLGKLQHLYLSKNQINDIKSLENIMNLKSLDLSGNRIETLPKWITKWNSEIKVIGRRQTNTIFLNNNPLKTPPLEIVKQGKDAIRYYFDQLGAQEEDYLFEAKLLIVGEPGAGKTSMARKLEDCNNPLPAEGETTRGIEVHQYYFSLRAADVPGFSHPSKLDGEQLRLNLWDFGGQAIYKATHRFFLSKRSLYVLVADSRKEDTDFNYWLNIVEVFGGDSPLLIVLNEKHGRKRKLDTASMLKRFENIQEVISVDFADDDHTRLNQLAAAVRYYVGKLPHIGNPVPINWTKVREALEQDLNNTISQQDYLNVCLDNGIEKVEDAMVLSQYFHDIGVFLHFQNDPVLKNLVFLKSNWATQAIYKVLDHSLLNEQNGRFQQADAKIIWNAPEYALLHDELLQLMKKFFLAYEIGNKKEFIVPDRLPEEQPNYDWMEANNLFMRYSYDIFMPKGLMSQIIVEMHAYINDHDLVWGRGVILEREKTKAEILETYDSRTIEIRISGKNRRDFMTIISETIDNVNGQYEKLQVDKLIPCTCSDCKTIQKPHFHEYQDLKRRIERGRREIECPLSYEMVNVRSLIDEVISPTRPVDKPFTSPLPATAIREKVFVSYSHKDKDWLERIQPHLKVLEHEGIAVNLWDDTEIKAGDSWREEIENALVATKVAILLVSTAFLASDFIMKKELPALLKSAKDDGAVVIPLIIKPCRFSKNKTLREIQSANPPSEALSGLSENAQDKVLVALADRVAEILGGE